jgi:hypothetical protein
MLCVCLIRNAVCACCVSANSVSVVQYRRAALQIPKYTALLCHTSGVVVACVVCALLMSEHLLIGCRHRCGVNAAL